MVVSHCLFHVILIYQLFVLTTCSLWEKYFSSSALLLSILNVILNPLELLWQFQPHCLKGPIDFGICFV